MKKLFKGFAAAIFIIIAAVLLAAYFFMPALPSTGNAYWDITERILLMFCIIVFFIFYAIKSVQLVNKM